MSDQEALLIHAHRYFTPWLFSDWGEVGVVVDEGMPVRVPDDMPMVDNDAPLKCPGSAVACPCWSP
jgi:hypothetical protein